MIKSAKDEIEDRVLDRAIAHDLNLNAKNLIVASVVMKRKSLKRNKK